MAAVLSPLYSTECRNFTFDFEEFIKNELGLDLDKPKKKEGKPAFVMDFLETPWPTSYLNDPD
jgi:hypothetical protein